MNLIEWLEAMGNKKVMALLGVSIETIYQWKRGDTSPKVMTAHKIVSSTGGIVTWESVYAPYVEKRTQKDPNQIEMKFKES